MGFTQTRTAVKKKWIVGIAGRLTYRKTACLSKPITRTNYKAVKGIIRMQSKFDIAATAATPKHLPGSDTELYRNKMAGYLLCSSRETTSAVVTQKLIRRLIRTAYLKQTPTQMQDR